MALTKVPASMVASDIATVQNLNDVYKPSPSTLTDSCTVDGANGITDYIITGLTTGRTLSFTNTPTGVKGNLWLNNGSGRTITKGSGIVCESSTFTTISSAGYYWIQYWHLGSGSVLVKASAAMS